MNWISWSCKSISIFIIGKHYYKINHLKTKMSSLYCRHWHQARTFTVIDFVWRFKIRAFLWKTICNGFLDWLPGVETYRVARCVAQWSGPRADAAVCAGGAASGQAAPRAALVVLSLVLAAPHWPGAAHVSLYIHPFPCLQLTAVACTPSIRSAFHFSLLLKWSHLKLISI